MQQRIKKAKIIELRKKKEALLEDERKRMELDYYLAELRKMDSMLDQFFHSIQNSDEKTK
jgi:hypothetical protein